LACAVAAPLAELSGLDPITILDRTPVRAAGVVLVVVGIAATLAGQLAMDASWRPDVDPTVRTALVTTGPFRLVRNPIFTATAATGLALLVPNLVAAAMLAAFLTALQVQVRLVRSLTCTACTGPPGRGTPHGPDASSPGSGGTAQARGRRRNDQGTGIEQPACSGDRRPPTYWRRPLSRTNRPAVDCDLAGGVSEDPVAACSR
jgi:Phospholipid methyltransferase